MPRKISAANLEERGLMEPEEAQGAELEERPPEEPAPAPEPDSEPAKEPPKEPPPPAPLPEESATYTETANERIRQIVAERNAERERAATAAREAAELREKWARLDERRAQAQEAEHRFAEERAQAERAAQRPDPAIDPQGAELWDLREGRRQDAERLSALEKRLTEGVQQTQASLQQQQMLNYLRDDISRFEREHPDYNAAAQYAAQKRAQFWMNLGHTEENARNIVQQETAAIVAQGANAGKSVAQTVYELATSWGYQKTANGAAAAPQEPTNGVTSQEKLRQVAAGQAVQGMPRTATAPGDGNDISRMSAAAIASMPEDDWLQIMANPVTAKAMNRRMAQLEME